MCAHRFYAKRFPVRPRSLTRIIVPYTPYAYRTVRIPLKFEFRPRTRIRRCTRGCSVQRPAPVLVPGPSIVDTDASGDGASGDCTSRERSCRAAGSGDLDHGEIYRFPGAGPATPPPQHTRARAREPRCRGADGGAGSRGQLARAGAAGPAEPSGRPRPGEGEARGRASGPPPLCRSPLCIDSMLGLFRQLRTDLTRARPSRTARRGFQAFSPRKRLVSSRRELDDGGTQRSSEVIRGHQVI